LSLSCSCTRRPLPQVFPFMVAERGGIAGTVWAALRCRPTKRKREFPANTGRQGQGGKGRHQAGDEEERGNRAGVRVGYVRAVCVCRRPPLCSDGLRLAGALCLSLLAAAREQTSDNATTRVGDSITQRCASRASAVLRSLAVWCGPLHWRTEATGQLPHETRCTSSEAQRRTLFVSLLPDASVLSAVA
jgi:hypothetical protein